MKNKADILIAVGLIVLGGIVGALHPFAGTGAIVLVFLGMIIAPGYVVSRLIIRAPVDPWEIYPVSFVVGAACFGVLGMFLFFLKAPLYAAYPAMAAIGIASALFALIKIKEPVEIESGWSKETGGLGWIFAVVIFLGVAVAYQFGGFRSWAVEWDYYTYITMVKRFVSRGFADNFSLTYANEAHDPIHSYNTWELMWAVVSKNSGADPIALYVKSVVVTIPAALLAFYSLTKSLFGRQAGMAATVCYATYHFVSMGFILMGRTGFNAEDPCWLIFFPMMLRFGWEYLNKGGRSDLAVCAISACIAAMTHPLWGAFSGLGVFLMASVKIASGVSAYNKKELLTTLAGWVALFAPALWAITMILTDSIVYGGKNPESPVGFIFFLGLPAGLLAPRVIKLAKNHPAPARRSAIAVITVALSMAPLIIIRGVEARGARADIFDALSPYKWFLTDSLFILNPVKFSYVSPDMTLFPWAIIGLATIPFLVHRYLKSRDAASLLVVSGVALIPLIAFHPYLSWLFCRFLHVAYLRRALRFSAMFAAIAAGVGIWSASRKAGKFSGASTFAIGLIVAVLSGLYPVDPPQFQDALSKSWFTMWHRPVEGLFWHYDMNAHRIEGVKWDTEDFSKLLENIPLQETVTSDLFTSYRLTAYRDLYVIARLKPSTGAMDQTQRERDSTDLITATVNSNLVCDIMRRYQSGWLLINTDPDYQLHELKIWHPLTIQSILESKDSFTTVGTEGEWVLLRANAACAP